MNTETKSETYDEYVARREQELFQERLAKDKYNLEKNRAMLNAKFRRFGINTPLPRSQADLEPIIKEERTILGADVHQDTRNAAIVKPDSEVKSEQSDTVNTSKEPLIGLNETVIANHETGDIEKLIHGHFDLVGHNSENGAQLDGAHLSCTEILLQCGAQPSKANVNTVSSLLKSLGFVSCKSKGKRGYRVTARAL